jgi:hypothetical protein
LGWQWYLVASPSWKTWLTAEGVQKEEIETLARRSGFAWPIESPIGPFALHTATAALFGVHLGPWLLSRWYVWIMPLLGMSSHTPTANDQFEHFELASIVPALVAGYLLARYFGGLAQYAWILPTIILAYKLLTFADAQTSVIAPHPWIRWEYFFVIQRTAPSFTPGFGGVDPIRTVDQMFVVAPFYAGLAYSAGAFAANHDLLGRIFGSSRMHPETETTGSEPE